MSYLITHGVIRVALFQMFKSFLHDPEILNSDPFSLCLLDIALLFSVIFKPNDDDDDNNNNIIIIASVLLVLIPSNSALK